MLLDNTIEIVEISQKGILVVHEKFERKYDSHEHSKGQLSYVEDGIAYLTIYNQTFIVPARYFFWIPEHIEHKLRVSHSATQLHSVYFPSSFKELDSFHTEFGIYPASDLIISILKFAEKWNKEYIDSTSKYYELIKSLYFLISEQKESRLNIMLPFSDDEKVKKVTQFIIDNYAESLSLDDMVEKFNMSERTFTRWFKKELGISFLQYLKSVRVVKAIELLLKTNLSIAEIALSVGYDSLPAFSNVFLQFTSKRPYEMRKYFEK